ncbi:hypothetical protein ACS8E9_18365 [Pseudomonas neustonica]|uniref:hypothetical protein n=1 Tax=Pseudomonas neustonica TaxID=2487346 RepID=UPI003F47B9A9
MNADWDDAPIRVRKKTNHLGMLISIAMTLGIFGGAAYMAQSKGWISLQPEHTTQVSIEHAPIERHQPEDSVKDDYDQQVDRLLRESAEQSPEAISDTKTYRQAFGEPGSKTESGDRNSVSQGDANLALLNAKPFGSGVQSQPQGETRSGSYVTVVEETKRSCWGAKEGSSSCRRIRQLTRKADIRNCEIGGNQAACDRANRY